MGLIFLLSKKTNWWVLSVGCTCSALLHCRNMISHITSFQSFHEVRIFFLEYKLEISHCFKCWFSDIWYCNPYSLFERSMSVQSRYRFLIFCSLNDDRREAKCLIFNCYWYHTRLSSYQTLETSYVFSKDMLQEVRFSIIMENLLICLIVGFAKENCLKVCCRQYHAQNLFIGPQQKSKFPIMQYLSNQIHIQCCSICQLKVSHSQGFSKAGPLETVDAGEDQTLPETSVNICLSGNGIFRFEISC